MNDIIQPQPLSFPPKKVQDNFVLGELKREALSPDGPLAQVFKQVGQNVNAKRKRQERKRQEQMDAEREAALTNEPTPQEKTQQADDQTTKGKMMPEEFSQNEIDSARPESGLIHTTNPLGLFLAGKTLATRLFEEDLSQYDFDVYGMDPSKPEPGLIHTTSPPEFFASGGAASFKIAGMQGLKLFTASAVPEFLAMMPAEEIGEEHPVTGFLLEAVLGVGTGAAAEKFFPELAEEMYENLAKNIPKIDTPEHDVKALRNAAKSDMSPFTVEPLPTKKARVSNAEISRKKVRVRKIKQDLAEGKLEDRELRQAAKQTIEVLQANSDKLTKKQQLQVEQTRRAIDDYETSIPEPTIGKGHQSPIRKTVAKQTREEWFGKPYYGTPEANKNMEAALAEANEEARRSATDPKKKPKKVFGNDLKLQAARKANTRKNVMMNSLRKRLSTLHGYEGNELERRVQKAFDARVAQGLTGHLFEDDLRVAVSKAVAQAKEAGQDVTGKNYWEIVENAEQNLIREYKDGVKFDTEVRLRQANREDFFGEQKEYIEGGDRDNWSITDYLRVNSDTGRLTFQGEKPQMPSKDQDTGATSKLFNFSEINTAAQAKRALEKQINDVVLLKPQKIPGSKTYFKDVPEARRLKVESQYTDKKTGKIKTNYVLPDKEVDNVARMLGWQEDLIQTENTMLPNGKVVRKLPEEVWNEYNLKRQWDVAHPEYFGNDWKKIREAKPLKAKLETLKTSENPEQFAKQIEELETQISALTGDIDMRHYTLSGSDQIYRNQRKAFIANKLGLDLNEPYDVKVFYRRLDQMAVLHNRFINDINRLGGSPDRDKMVKMYTILQDRLGGTNKYETLLSLDRKSVRDIARQEAELFGQNKDYNPRLAQERIAKLADEQGISREEATEIYRGRLGKGIFSKNSGEFEQDIQRLMDEDTTLSREQAEEDYFQSLEEAQIRHDIDQETQDQWAREAGETGSQRYYDKDEAVYKTHSEAADDQKTVRLKHEPRTAATDPSESFATSKAFAQIEDRVGSRLIDPLYEPSVLPDGAGRINLLRTNSVDDILDMLKAFDSPLDPKEFGVKGTVADTLLDDIDPEIQLGVTPYKGHPQSMVNRLATLASDVQDQLNEAAEILVQEPDNALSAITFDKLKAVQNTILGQLTQGQPSSESLAQLARMDFTAITDRGGLENVSDAIRDLYIVTTKNGELSVDARIPVEQAKMLSNIDDPAAQTKFLREISLVEEASGIPQLQAKLQGMRKTASQIIKDNCGV